jgi:hypothetical protein
MHFKFRDRLYIITYPPRRDIQVVWRHADSPANATYRHLEDDNLKCAMKLWFDSQFDMSFQDFLTKMGF